MFEVEKSRRLAERLAAFIVAAKQISDGEVEQYRSGLDSDELTAATAISARQMVDELTDMVYALSEAVLSMLEDNIAQKDLGIDP